MEKADAGKSSGRGGPDKRLISFLRSIDKATEREEAEAGERVRSRKREAAEPLNEESDASDDDGQGMEEEGAEESGWEDEQPESAPPIEFANAMARILGKHADGENPILCKRKTPNMRLMEETKEESRERRQSAQDRKLRRERFMVKPDATRLNFEKRLRKVATQGIVQLFNSVRQHQQALKHAGADRAGVAAPHKQKEVRKAQNENFLRMLREATGASKGGGEGARDEGAAAAGGKVGNKAAGKAGGTAARARWAVLDENLMLGSSSMRAWDRDEHVAKEATQRRARGKKGRGGGGGGDDDIFVQDRAGDAGASKIAWSDDED